MTGREYLESQGINLSSDSIGFQGKVCNVKR